MITPLSYEEWKKLPGSVATGIIVERPDWFEFGKDDSGKAVARMTESGMEAHQSMLEKKYNLPTGTLPR